MGMDYYYNYGRCECCHRYEQVHIGKSSAGWTFNFQGTEEIRSYADWLHFFESNPGEVVTQYGEIKTVDAFKELVEAKRTERNNHALNYPKGNWLDPDGHSFSSYI